jgi:hypothetical protein
MFGRKKKDRSEVEMLKVQVGVLTNEKQFMLAMHQALSARLDALQNLVCQHSDLEKQVGVSGPGEVRYVCRRCGSVMRPYDIGLEELAKRMKAQG